MRVLIPVVGPWYKGTQQRSASGDRGLGKSDGSDRSDRSPFAVPVVSSRTFCGDIWNAEQESPSPLPP